MCVSFIQFTHTVAIAMVLPNRPNVMTRFGNLNPTLHVKDINLKLDMTVFCSFFLLYSLKVFY